MSDRKARVNLNDIKREFYIKAGSPISITHNDFLSLQFDFYPSSFGYPKGFRFLAPPAKNANFSA